VGIERQGHGANRQGLFRDAHRRFAAVTHMALQVRSCPEKQAFRQSRTPIVSTGKEKCPLFSPPNCFVLRQGTLWQISQSHAAAGVFEVQDGQLEMIDGTHPITICLKFKSPHSGQGCCTGT
jgi:hypothetical protein